MLQSRIFDVELDQIWAIYLFIGIGVCIFFAIEHVLPTDQPRSGDSLHQRAVRQSSEWRAKRSEPCRVIELVFADSIRLIENALQHLTYIPIHFCPSSWLFFFPRAQK